MKSPALRLGLLAVLVSFVMVAMPQASASAYAPATSPGVFGVNGGMLRAFVDPDKAATLEALATSMGQEGISWSRLTFDQSMEEPQPGSFNWYTPDTIIAALARHGVRGAAVFV